MNPWIIVPLAVLITGAGFFNYQGSAMLMLSIFFGASDGAQTFLEQNPANPHPVVRLPKE